MNAKLVYSLFISLSASIASAGGKHVHGEAELFIAIDDKQVLIELESPAGNILGFEHKPSTEAQQQLLQRRLQLLSQYTSLLTLDKNVCKQTDSEVESPFAEHQEHNDHHEHEHENEHKDHHEHENEHEGNHSDFQLKYSLTCSNTVAITSANITAFKVFEGFETIQVNWLTPKGQGSSKATPGKTEITFK